ncbi:hypothetical protein CDAR_18461 [Caerostris darwini]|uniref:Uncharacterized protein n=1 Tax=Caerostris darwini TaxID=1538125 RepID=A0AAV4VAY7_9ARAC|nr:hypothetical protein CDAR_18461 [Caerostris darwini]
MKNFRMFEGMVVERGLVLEYIADSPSRIAYLREEIESKIFFFILRVTYFPQVKPAKSEANRPMPRKKKVYFYPVTPYHFPYGFFFLKLIFICLFFHSHLTHLSSHLQS